MLDVFVNIANLCELWASAKIKFLLLFPRYAVIQWCSIFTLATLLQAIFAQHFLHVASSNVHKSIEK